MKQFTQGIFASLEPKFEQNFIIIYHFLPPYEDFQEHVYMDAVVVTLQHPCFYVFADSSLPSEDSL